MDGKWKETMRSPQRIGNLLLAISLCVIITPLICWVVQFLQFMMWLFVDDDASTQQSSSTTTTLVPHFTLSTIANVGKQLPRTFACSLTAYIGICLGYVGLVHLGIINADKNQLKPKK